MQKKKYRLFGIIHAADIIWLGLVAVLVYGAMHFAQPVGLRAGQGDVTVRYTIELGMLYIIPEGFHKTIPLGDYVFDGIRGANIGTVVDVFARQNQSLVFDEDENIVRSMPVAGQELLYIVVEAPAVVSDFETTIGLYPIAVGRPVAVRSKHFAGEGFIISIEVLQ